MWRQVELFNIFVFSWHDINLAFFFYCIVAKFGHLRGLIVKKLSCLFYWGLEKIVQRLRHGWMRKDHVAQRFVWQIRLHR